MTSKTMVLISSLAFALASLVSATPAQGQTSFQVNGVNADYFACDNNNNCTVLFLMGNSSGTSGKQFFLLYSVQTFDGTQITNYNGFGQIPASAVSGGSEQTTNLTVNIDTSQLSGFANSVCVIDPITFTGTCNNAAGGVVNVTWKGTPQISSQSNTGTKTATVAPNLQTTMNFQTNTTSSIVSGTTLGIAVIPGGEADLGSGHNGQITITKP